MTPYRNRRLYENYNNQIITYHKPNSNMVNNDIKLLKTV